MANKEFLAALLAAALEGDDDDGEGEPKQKQTDPPKQKQAEGTAGLTAEQIEEAMDKRFKSLAESLDDKQAKVGEGKNDDDNKSGEGKTELTDAQVELIETKLESAFVTKGFDKETVSGLSEFLDYATMNDDEGKLSEEKITSLVEAISSVALREPPKGKRKNLPSSKSQGFSKYLDKDN